MLEESGAGRASGGTWGGSNGVEMEAPAEGGWEGCPEYRGARDEAMGRARRHPHSLRDRMNATN